MFKEFLDQLGNKIVHVSKSLWQLFIYTGIIIAIASCEVYSEVTVESSVEGVATLAVHYIGDNKVDGQTKASHSGYIDDNSSTDLQAEYKIYANQTNNNYLFGGWTGSDGNTYADKNTTIKVYATPGNKYWGGSKYTYTANWLVPQVTDVTFSDTEEISSSTSIMVNNPSETYPKNAVFTIEQSLSEEDYNLTSSFNSVSNAHEEAGVSATFKTDGWTATSYSADILYSPTKVHNTPKPDNIDDGTNKISYEVTPADINILPYLGTVTLTSKYKGGGDTYSSQTCSLTITEDYLPRYTMPANYEKSNQINDFYIEDLIPTIIDDNYAAKYGTWSFSLADDSQDKDHFIISYSTFADLKIHVDPKGENQNVSAAKELKATLISTCTYTDNAGTKLKTTAETELIITFSPLTEPILQFVDKTTGNEIDELIFEEEVEYNGVVSKTVVLNQYSIEELALVWEGHNPNKDGEEYFTYSPNNINEETKDIVITLNPDAQPIIGEKSVTLKATGTGIKKSTNSNGEEEETTVQKNCTLSVKVTVVLSTPELSVSMTSTKASLNWTSILGATGYKVYYKKLDGETPATLEQLLSEEGIPCPETSTEITVEENERYSFVVVALWDEDHDYDQPSNIVTDIAQNVVDVITASNAEHTGMFTGTEKWEEGDNVYGKYPYEQKREIDVSAAFNGTTAIFDTLYIYGLTLSSDGSDEITYATARTPLYIYYKDPNNSTQYLKVSTEIEMNSSAKPFWETGSGKNKQKHEPMNTVANDQKLYFTGWCPYASTGSSWSENGVFYAKGDGKKSLDIYLDHAQIYARGKGDGGNKKTYSITDISVAQKFLTGGLVSMQGSGGVFVFTSTTQNFIPKIHLCKHNELKATDGLTVDLNATYEGTTIKGTYEQYGSPIQILPIALGQKTTIEIDNIWPENNSRTSGELELLKMNDIAPLFDIGNEATEIRFNGGHLCFDNASDKLLMAYRKVVRTEVDDENNEISIPIYGAYTASNGNHDNGGSDIQGGILKINDGTYSAMSMSPLKLPAQTTFNGGSYNCDVTANGSTDLVNSDGKPVRRFQNIEYLKYGSVENGLAKITNFSQMVDDLFTVGAGVKNDGIAITLSRYYLGAPPYGHSSLVPTAEAESVVHLMLPYFEGANIPWDICSPSFTTTVSGTTVPAGGGISEMPASNIATTKRLLYMDIDAYTHNALTGYVGPYGAPVILSEGEENYGTIDHESNYTITEKVYMLKPVVADTWMLFAAPFDVAAIYVIESYPEKQLKLDFNAVRGRIPQENVLQARTAQARRTMDLYNYWYRMMAEGQDVDVFDTDGANGFGDFVESWITYETNNKVSNETTANYKPSIQKLIYYNGENANDAHYFLYKAAGSWTYNESSQKFESSNASGNEGWTFVDKNGTNKIMEKGTVYALQFPHNVIGGTHNPDESWDYWTGKYLLIESTTGSHEINGKNYSPISTDELDSKTGLLRGNSTFAKLTDLEGPTNASLWGLDKIPGAGRVGNVIYRDQHLFKRKNATDISLIPTEGFMLANIPETSNMRARTINYKTGEVTYEKIEDENPDDDNPGLGSGVPTIMGDLSLMVVPTAEGLTITPLKEQHVMLFDAEGKMIFSKYMSEEENVSLPTGVYVVRGEYEQVKAIKK